MEAEVLAQRDRLQAQVKQEPKSSLVPGEIIDLTDGDELEIKVECKRDELKEEDGDEDTKLRPASPRMIDEVRKLRVRQGGSLEGVHRSNPIIGPIGLTGTPVGERGGRERAQAKA